MQHLAQGLKHSSCSLKWQMLVISALIFTLVAKVDGSARLAKP